MRFIDSDYSGEHHKVSMVTIEHKGKYFTGYADLHPDDAAAGIGSELTGCRYAETRARIKALKYELKQKKHDCDEIRKFVRAVEGYKNFDKESSTAKAMYRQLNQRVKQVNKLIDEINLMIFGLRMSIRKQDNINNTIAARNVKE